MSGQLTPADSTTIAGGGGIVQPVVAVALDTAGGATPRSFGISDPIAGYAAATQVLNTENEMAYTTPFDHPLDSIAAGAGGDSNMLTNGVKPDTKSSIYSGLPTRWLPTMRR